MTSDVVVLGRGREHESDGQADGDLVMLAAGRDGERGDKRCSGPVEIAGAILDLPVAETNLRFEWVVSVSGMCASASSSS